MKYDRFSMLLEIPRGNLCEDYDNCCQFLKKNSPYCNLFHERILQFDGNLSKKVYRCIILQGERVCINCGHFDNNDGYCDILKRRKAAMATCENFVYGSWK